MGRSPINVIVTLRHADFAAAAAAAGVDLPDRIEY